MKFGVFPIGEAAGVILAHTVRAGSILKKKGHVITSADIAVLTASGIRTVIGARLDLGDVDEDAAAAEIGAVLSGPHAKPTSAHTGRCNLVASANGVVIVDKAAIDAANEVDEAVTIATVPGFTGVRDGQIIATIKIIPFAVPEHVLSRVKAAVSAGGLQIRPFRARKVALVSTLLPGLKPSVVVSTEDTMRTRIAEIDAALMRSTQINHEAQAVAAELRAAVASGAEMVLIVGASATADRGDVVPAGIVAAGGSISHFGMPVDPGNLLVLGRIGNAPVLVLPGCARSPKLNGADWILQRLAADIPVSGRDIMAMGVGGLLVDTPSRPLPRDQAVADIAPSSSSRISAIILAAGQSRRMGGRNKLLLDIGGEPLVRRTVKTALAAPVHEVIVVTGHESEALEAALHGLEVRFVNNPNFSSGLSTSLKIGVGAVGADASGAIVCLGDMPELSPSHLARVIDGFDPGEGREIGVPTHGGKRGNPVLWGRRFFQEMRELSGDVGARHLIGANESLVYEVEFDDTGVLMDLDTPGQWEDFIASSSSPRE